MARLRAKKETHSLVVDLNILDKDNKEDQQFLKRLENLAVNKEYMVNFVYNGFYAEAKEFFSQELLENSNVFAHEGTTLYMCDQLDSVNVQNEIVAEIRTFDSRRIVYVGNNDNIIDQLKDEGAKNEYRKTKSTHKATQYFQRL